VERQFKVAKEHCLPDEGLSAAGLWKIDIKRFAFPFAGLAGFAWKNQVERACNHYDTRTPRSPIVQPCVIVSSWRTGQSIKKNYLQLLYE
jgi:hypothetical protein